MKRNKKDRKNNLLHKEIKRTEGKVIKTKMTQDSKDRKRESMQIVMLTSEARPYAMTGGLADVVSSLSSALSERGDNVTVILPYYKQKMTKFSKDISVKVSPLSFHFDGRIEYAQVLELKKSNNLRFLFIEYDRYFDRPALYDWNGIEYGDNAERFIFFSRAAMQTIISLGISPDIIHAHDWHTALACVYLKSHLYSTIANFAKTSSVITVHNIAYQGCFHKSQLYFTGLGWEYFNHLCLEFYDHINLLKGGIMTADFITTVSPTHAEEILSPAYGFNLDAALRHRASEGKLKGVLNGIDIKEWNPETDHIIAKNYSITNLKGKLNCKYDLQSRTGLPQKPDVPLFGLISRLAYQKGIDVFATAVENMLMYDDVQFVVLASGDPNIENHLHWLASKFPDKFKYTAAYNSELSHIIEAGADLFVMPSRYEPCGLNQMYSMRYGTLPIVRATGGLHDTVINYDTKTLESSTGFKFWDLNPESLRNTMRWAASVYRNEKDNFRKMQINAMKKDFSWNKTAGEYEEIYRNIAGRFRLSTST